MKTVVIIGAGPAGLTAAHELLSKGGTDKSALWNVNTEEEYHESK